MRKLIITLFIAGFHAMRADGQIHSQQTLSEEQVLATLPVAYRDSTGAEVMILHPLLGDTIDADEAAMFGLFQSVHNLVSAQYLRTASGTFSVRVVSFDENGVEQIEVQPVVSAGLLTVRNRIQQDINEAFREKRRMHEKEEPTPKETLVQPEGGTKDTTQATTPSGRKRSAKDKKKYYYGIGKGVLVFPSNSAPVSSFGPDGESVSFVAIEGIGPGPGWGYSMSTGGGYWTKRGADSDRGPVTYKYSFSPVISLVATYEFSVGAAAGSLFDKTGLVVGGGLSLHKVGFGIPGFSTANHGGNSYTIPESELKAGPIAMAGVNILLGESPLMAFARATKVWSSYDFRAEDLPKVNLGPMSYYAGIAVGL